VTQAIALTSSSASGGAGVASPAPAGDASRPQLEKARLEVYDSVPAKAGGASLGARRQDVDIPFQFNPKEVTIQKSAKWERKPVRGAKSAGPPQFTGAEPCKLTLEMFFDASAKHDRSVVDAVEKLFTCCVPTEKTRGDNKAWPPLVIFQWGKIKSFPAFITQVSAKYTLFAPDGTPIRATCSVSMEEMPGDPTTQKQNPTSGGLTVSRVHTLVQGDSLASVAYGEYDDPEMWRLLAEYNGIDDPMRLACGTVLLLPAPEELLATGG